MGRFSDVINKITKDYKDCLKVIDDSTNSTETDFLKKSEIELKGVFASKEKETIHYPKMLNIFYTLCSKLTDEEFDKLEEEITRKKGPDFLPTVKERTVKWVAEFKGVKVEDLTLKRLYKSFGSGFFHDEVDEYNSFLIDLLGEERCNEVTSQIENFDPEKERYVRDFAPQIEEAKVSLRESNLTEDEKKKIEDALDKVNELEIVSKSQEESFASSCNTVQNKITRYYATKFIDDNKLNDVYRYKDPGVEYKNEVIDNPKLIEKTLKSEYSVSKEDKDAIIAVYNKMDELGLLDEMFISEQSIKVYGMTRFRTAQLNMRGAIENKDFKNIVKFKDEYVKQYNNLKEIYAFIKETIKPDFLHFPGNMTSYRQSFIPKEFANDLPVNATLNGFYYLFSTIKASNITIDRFVENPITACKTLLDDLYTKDEVNNTLNNLSRVEKIARMYNLKNYSVGRTTLRLVENVSCHETKVNSRNVFENALYIGSIDLATLASPIYGDTFFRRNTDKTLLNVLLTHNDNIAMLDLYGGDYKTRDALHTAKAFDTKSYVESHDVNVDELIDYAKVLIKEVAKVYDNGVYGLDGVKIAKEISEDELLGMVGSFFNNISNALALLGEYKDLSIAEFDKIRDFMNKPRESLKDLGLNQKIIDKCVANEIMADSYDRFVKSNKFYGKLKDFNKKYGLKITLKDFEGVGNIDFNQNEFFKNKFVEVFNKVWNNSNPEQREFYEGASITDRTALFEFVTAFNDITNVVIGEKLGIEGASPLETMTNKEKIEMFERAYGVNRIVNVKLNQISYRSYNNSGYSHFTHQEKCEHFYSAHESINRALDEYSPYNTYNSEQKKAFLQSYREVYQAMTKVHNTSWFFRMIAHFKDYRQEKALLNETLDRISNTLKLDKAFVKEYLSKPNDVLRSGTKEQFKNDPLSTKSYNYDEAIEVSETITRVNEKINEKFELNTPAFDPLLREQVEAVDELDNPLRVNIENIDLEGKKVEAMAKDVTLEINNKKELNK